MNLDLLQIEDAEFAKLTVGVIEKWPYNFDRLLCTTPIQISLRKNGALIDSHWYENGYFIENLSNSIERTNFSENGELGTIGICLAHDFGVIPNAEISTFLKSEDRGILGLEIQLPGITERASPIEAIATNRSFARAFERFLSAHKLSRSQFLEAGGQTRCFKARQILINLEPAVQAITMHRGNRIVRQEQVTPNTLSDMVATMGDWMKSQVSAQGRMTYKYWPSRGSESERNNTIRQFMATVCLIRLARFHDDISLMSLAARNLQYNLQQYFGMEDGVGIIEHDGSAKLGAAALAGLAILELPENNHHMDVLNRLVAGVDSLWQDTGAFRTFHIPAQRNDNQNFYPGEALLFWVKLYEVDRNEYLLERIVKSVTYYRDWHRRNRNPAFVPWHSQAYARLFEITGKTFLRDLVFEMNDWLLPLQQWNSAPASDLRGRFYDETHPEYGPPHASSTGAYLEGLIAAYELAKQAGDSERSEAYATVIWRGIRNLRQLQFIDDVDMFYISKRSRVRGALRTETYNNEIRVDNVQHGLMALLALSRLPDFKDLR